MNGRIQFKFKTIIEGFSKIREGDVDSGIKLLQEAYAVKRDDLLTLNACFNLILQLNPVNPINHEKIVQYSSDGEQIAKKINLSGFVILFRIVKMQILLIQNITALSQILLRRKISELQKEDFIGFLIQEDVLILYNIQQRIILKIGVFLNRLIHEKSYFEFIISLIIMLECVTYQVQKLGFIREDFIKIESEHRRPLISLFEKISESITDKQLQQLAYCKLGNYYFSICNYEKAEEYIRNSIALAHDLGNLGAEKDLMLLLDDIVQQKNPYDPKNRMQEKELEEMPFVEIKQLLIRQMELQGFDLSKSDDPKIEAINLAILDSDPTRFLKHCEYIRIAYISTSMFGKIIGLPALGQKVVWCYRAKTNVSGFSLEGVFNSFIRTNCSECTEMQPREKEWKCTFGEFGKIILDPDFQEFLKKLHKTNSAEEQNDS